MLGWSVILQLGVLDDWFRRKGQSLDLGHLLKSVLGGIGKL